ncbi:DUF4179 domain-containing protein [Clostridium paraputrificum]|uniref:DUF4179 domain-containing protein n=1 Tax=Clostridium TaxID=1485 RepID=UPI003D3562F2
MDKDIFEKEKLEYEKMEIPENLDFAVRSTLKRAKWERNKMRILKGIGGFAVACILFVAIVNLSPTIAQALSSIPGLDKLVRIATADFEDKGLRNAADSGMAKEINYYESKDGVNLKVLTVAGDYKNLWINYEINDIKKYNIKPEIIGDNGENIMGGMLFDRPITEKDSDAINVNFREFIPKFNLKLEIYDKTTSEEYPYGRLVTTFTVPIELDKEIFDVPMKEIELSNTNIKTEVGNIKIHSLESSKTRTVMKFNFESEDYKFMDFKNPRLIDEEGNEYVLPSWWHNGGNDEFNQLELQGEIKGDVKKIRFVCDGIYYGPKEVGKITLDIKNKKVEDNYYGFEVKSWDENNKVVLEAKNIVSAEFDSLYDEDFNPLIKSPGSSWYLDENEVNSVAVNIEILNYREEKAELEIYRIIKDKTKPINIELK